MFRATHTPAGRGLKPLRQLDDLPPVSGISILLKARSNASPSSVDGFAELVRCFAMTLHT
jgi:hypothetical protein